MKRFFILIPVVFLLISCQKDKSSLMNDLKMSFDVHYLSYAEFKDPPNKMDALASYPIAESQRIEIEYSKDDRFKMVTTNLPSKYNIEPISDSPHNPLPKAHKTIITNKTMKIFDANENLIDEVKFEIKHNELKVLSEMIQKVKDEGYVPFDFSSMLTPSKDIIDVDIIVRNDEPNMEVTKVTENIYDVKYLSPGNVEGIDYAYSLHRINTDSQKVYYSYLYGERNNTLMTIHYNYDASDRIASVYKQISITSPSGHDAILKQSTEIDNLEIQY